MPATLRLIFGLTLFFVGITYSSAQQFSPPSPLDEKLHFGFSTGYAHSSSALDPTTSSDFLNILPGHDAFGGADIWIYLNQLASFRTGFRLRQKTVRVQIDQYGQPVLFARDHYSIAEIPLAFSYRKGFADRFFIKQEIGLQLLALGGYSFQLDSLSSNPPTLAIEALPEAGFRGDLFGGLGMEYQTAKGTRFELSASYHVGLGQSFREATVVYRSPDSELVIPLYSDASYWAVYFGFHIPASRFGEVWKFIF